MKLLNKLRKKTLPENKRATKDPKKVAAGKNLAEYNKIAKEALAREMKREEETSPKETETSQSKAWMPELSFTTVLSLVGIGFTAVDMFMRYYKNRVVDLSQVPNKATELPKEPPPSKITIKKETPTTKKGMLYILFILIYNVN